MSFRLSAAAVKLQVEAALAHKVPSALTVAPRPMPEMMATGIAELDSAIGGIARGTVTEICGPASSGRTSVLLSLLAQVTRRSEAVALIDGTDAFHPESAAKAGVELQRMLWVRCGQPSEKPLPPRTQWDAMGNKRSLDGTLRVPLGMTNRKERLKPVEQVLKTTDLLLQAGGFGLIVVDLGDVRAEDARRVPLTTWFRFRRAIENTPTALVIVEKEPYAKTCASLVLELKATRAEFLPQWSQSDAMGYLQRCANAVLPTHSHLLHGMCVAVEISRGQLIGKKRPASVPAFETTTAFLSPVP